jgi:hypothetical protein
LGLIAGANAVQVALMGAAHATRRHLALDPDLIKIVNAG